VSGIAIVGLACVFPGAPDADTFWRNVVDGVDAITEVPEGRLDSVFYDPESSALDRVYCRRGGFVDAHASFDPLAFGIMPAAAEGAEPDQLLTLHVAAQALADAGLDSRPFPRERTNVVLGRGNYVGAGMLRLEQHVRTAQQLVEVLRSLLPWLDESSLRAVKEEFQAQLPRHGPDTAIGLVPNLTASRVANRLDLGGAAYTVDAACASALVAVDQACRDLLARRADVALAGGVHLCHEPSFWSVFCQLGALSRSEEIRPFDQTADGLLIGEGVGIVALRRLHDAEAAGDNIYAVLRGTGVASDGRHASLMTPSVEGELLSLRRAWEQARLAPETVGLVEAHGTATPAGDAAELETLGAFFGTPNGRRAGLGSVKSMIGHAMPAAGAAGLIKAALAVHHGVLPPSLHCESPRDELAHTRFRVITEAEPWEGEPRRAGVNAFGFGGINAHVILDQHAAGARRARLGAREREHRDVDERMLVLSAPSQEELLAALDGTGAPAPGAWRLAVADPTPERLAAARRTVEGGRPRRGRDGIFFSPSGLLSEGGLVAFVFPAVEAVFEPRADDVARHFDRPSPPPAPEEDLERRGVAIIRLGQLLQHALSELGVRPDAIAGHSIGEWTGMVASGMLTDKEVDDFVAGLTFGSLSVPGVAFAAVGCGAARAAAAAAALPGVFVSHDNCTHQSILCGPDAEVDVALERLLEKGVLGQKLEFPHGGFHTPLFADYIGPFRRSISELPLQPPAIPLWSATTCSPYPEDVDAFREVAVSHLLEPVRFRELVLALYEYGVRVFVQVGTGSVPAFIDDTLGRKPHLAIAANVPQRSGLAQLRRVAAALYVEGAPVLLDVVDIEGARASTSTTAQLALGVPLVRAATPLAVPAPLDPAEPGDPVGAAFQTTMRRLQEVQSEVSRVLAAGPVRPALRELVERRTFSVEEFPELTDHCLFPQPAGRSVAEGYPVVPMTMSIELLLDAARRAAPGLVPVELRDFRAAKWLAVEPPVEVTIRVRPDGDRAARVSLEGYAEATVLLAEGYPPAPAPDPTPLQDEGPPRVSVEELYDRWLFHGPAYQCVVEIGAFARDGIQGVLEARPARGALLDAVGQLFGHWFALSVEEDNLVMPLGLQRLEFFGPDLQPGDTVECVVRVRHMGRRDARADIELVRGGRVHARLSGWEDWRFDADKRTWRVIIFPETSLLSDLRPDGYMAFDRTARRVPSQDFLARRYLSARERAEFETLSAPRKDGWLHGRIAVKDAVRQLLWARGAGPLFPIEIAVDREPSGRPVVSGPFDEDVRVSLAHKNNRAVALARVGQPVGIDLETVESRGAGFASAFCTDQERALLPAGDPDEWLARLWCAKEAAGKALGTGLAGAPRDLTATALDDERFTVAGFAVDTRDVDGYVVAWTSDEEAA
jgi:3-oxoacyl-(acyl-carrier-protein) synthase/phosphopantetheinyl transferase